jgi:hypothetical protein
MDWRFPRHMEEEIIMRFRMAYNEPRIATFDTDEKMSVEDAILEFEEQYPEAIDIEILEVIEE